MTESMPLFLATIQALVLSQIFNEKLHLGVTNTVHIDCKKKSKSDLIDLTSYRKLDKELVHSEQNEIKMVAETLYYKSQKIPSKRMSENLPAEKVKKAKRETVRVMNEDFPVYKTMQFIDEVQMAPVFSREETMPQLMRNHMVPKESKFYVEVEIRVNKIAKVMANSVCNSLQKYILANV